MASDGPRLVSRRDLFKSIGVVGAAAVGADAGVPGAGAQAPPVAGTVQGPTAAPEREVLEHLTAAEADTLEAMVARIIPHGRSAVRGARRRAPDAYIDRALGGALADSPRAYTAGLAAARRVRARRPAARRFTSSQQPTRTLC